MAFLNDRAVADSESGSEGSSGGVAGMGVGVQQRQKAIKEANKRREKKGLFDFKGVSAEKQTERARRPMPDACCL